MTAPGQKPIHHLVSVSGGKDSTATLLIALMLFPESTSAPDDGRGALRGRDIHSYVRWAKTFRGGKVANPIWDEPAPACASSYGLCE